MEKIKLIAIDIDGTLLDDQGKISQANIAAINAATQAGIKVVLASGRPLSGLRKALTQLGLWDTQQYSIASNGAIIQENKTAQILSEKTLPLSALKELSQYAQRYDVNLVAQDHQFTYNFSDQPIPETKSESQKVHLPIKQVQLADFQADAQFIKIMFLDQVPKITALIPKMPAPLFEKYTLVHSIPEVFEAMNKTAGKGAGLKALSQTLALDPANLMAIGDQANDISMLDFAGTGIAMGNAINDVKVHAQYITTTNNENGVAHAINRFAFGIF